MAVGFPFDALQIGANEGAASGVSGPQPGDNPLVKSGFDGRPGGVQIEG